MMRPRNSDLPQGRFMDDKELEILKERYDDLDERLGEIERIVEEIRIFLEI